MRGGYTTCSAQRESFRAQGRNGPHKLCIKTPSSRTLERLQNKKMPSSHTKGLDHQRNAKSNQWRPHKSALNPEAVECMYKEVDGKIQKGQVRVVTWDELKKKHTKKAKNLTVGNDPT